MILKNCLVKNSLSLLICSALILGSTSAFSQNSKPASMQGGNEKVLVGTKPLETKPAPPIKIEEDDELVPSMFGPDLKADATMSTEEVKKRAEAAKDLMNSKEVRSYIDQLGEKKASIIERLQKNNCVQKGFDTEIGNFIDKLVNKKYNQNSLAMGFSSLFNVEEISSIKSNIHNPPKELQNRLGMLAIQFVMNESPQLFSQAVVLSQNRECLNKKNFE